MALVLPMGSGDSTARMNVTPPEAPAPASGATRGPWVWIATFFGAGLAPVAPGTVGSVASFVIWAPVVLLGVPWWARLGLVAVIFLLGIPACARASSAFSTDDPKQAVIDEVAGQGLTLLFAAAHPVNLVAGFALFRLFDVVKPWPIRWVDRNVHGGLGVMLDDLVAGAFALALLLLLERYGWPALGLFPFAPTEAT